MVTIPMIMQNNVFYCHLLALYVPVVVMAFVAILPRAHA